MPTHPNQPDIQIIAYVAVNEIQHLSDDNQQISRYVRSFRYENHDPLVSRRMAFNKLLDEKQSRMFGYDDNPEEQFRGLSLFMEYLAPYNKGLGDTRELKKLYLLTGKHMSSDEQMERWENELKLLQAAFPQVHYPVMPSTEGDKDYEILETESWIKMYFFYTG
jgi:hypothetical protein